MMAGRERKSESNKTKEGKLDEMELLVKQRNEGQVRRGAELITRNKERKDRQPQSNIQLLSRICFSFIHCVHSTKTNCFSLLNC